ncbi:MAG: hypothetical protein FK734_11950 [Asgard group archaeon]|nr:hypothetical protein [Asgard group archaeon]
MPKHLKSGTTRRYGRVLFLTAITFGIYYLFYQWWLFKDLEDHYKKVFKTESQSYPTLNNPATMFIFVIILPLYAIYVKYNLLHEHVATSKVISQPNCIEAFKAVIFFLLFGFTTLGILPLILEQKWQKAFNEHILAHESKKTS